MDTILYRIKKYIPIKLFRALQPVYHYALALCAALWYRFPSRNIIVIGVTGTKGKTSVVEITNAIFETAGYSTALVNTVRYKVANESYTNTFKMTMPGRFFMQRLLRKAVREKCQYAIIEMTSEGAKQHRHKFIALDALVFTNLMPEHIESHGSYEKYRDAKLSLAHALEQSGKKRRIIVANNDDREGSSFLNINVPEKYPFSLSDAKPYEVRKRGLWFTFEGERIESHLSGTFNIYNLLASAFLARAYNINVATIKKTLASFRGIPGRVEYIEEGQDYTVIVDYAHTPDSLEKVYDIFPHTRKICVLGSAGGGRDRSKRKEMGRIADAYCASIILTNEDPYDENPRAIVEEIQKGITSPTYEIEMDRRVAIRKALRYAKTGDAVLITGKGTDPYIMGANGTKLPWNDAKVTREELQHLLRNAKS